MVFVIFHQHLQLQVFTVGFRNDHLAAGDCVVGAGDHGQNPEKKTMENHEEDGTKMQKMEKNEQKWKNWLVVLTILKNRKVSGKDDIPYMKWKIIQMFETTNQKRRPAWSESSG